MKTTVGIILSLVVATLSNAVNNPRQAKEIGRRQFNGYANNILHENPNYPNQSAQSSVKVNFAANQQKPVYASNVFQQHEKPVYPQQDKTVFTHQQEKPLYQQVYSPAKFSQDYQPQYTQNYPTETPHPQSQLFNVGYSVSFTGGNKAANKPKYPRTSNLDDGEIITGTRKQNEEVEVPSINMSPQEYVSAALIGTKKQKVSGIKPKPQFVSNYPNPKVLLSQANLSPNTQKYYKVLEQFKPQVQNTQELQQKYSWRNLGPGVEIIRSTEIPTKFSRPDAFPGRALGRSEEFGYSNAIDNNSPPQQNTLFYNVVRKSQPKTQEVSAAINQNVGVLPMDTSLLHEPVTLQVDSRLLENTAGQQQILYSKYRQPQEQAQEVDYLQQNYRTIPVEETGNTNPALFYQQNYPQDQSRFQLKIYGKPQPIPVNYDDRQNEELKRQPRFVPDLHTNLRPPPFDLPYQRRGQFGY